MECTKKQYGVQTVLKIVGVPGGTRTPGLLVRSQALYPAELQAHALTTRVIIPAGLSDVKRNPNF